MPGAPIVASERSVRSDARSPVRFASFKEFRTRERLENNRHRSDAKHIPNHRRANRPARLRTDVEAGACKSLSVGDQTQLHGKGSARAVFRAFRVWGTGDQPPSELGAV